MKADFKRILIADTDVPARLTLTKFFSKKGYKIEIAQHGAEIIQKVKHAGVDVLILDADLLGIKGDDIVTIVKEIDPQLPIILISNKDSIELANKIRKIGVLFYAIKPLDLKELDMAVRSIFNKSKKIGG